MRALYDADGIVTGIIEGDADHGIEIPEALRVVEPHLLRVDSGRVIDVSRRTRWYVDAAGQKHHKAGEGRQMVRCDAATELVRDGEAWRIASDADKRSPLLKRECSRRIRAVLSDRTQQNFTAYAADLALKGSALSAAEQGDVDTMRAAREWTLAMLEECRARISDGEPPQWPVAPMGVAALAARF